MITQDTSITWWLYDTYTTKYDDTAIPWDSQVSDSHGKNILKDLYFTSGKHGHMVKIHHVKIRIYFLWEVWWISIAREFFFPSWWMSELDCMDFNNSIRLTQVKAQELHHNPEVPI